MPLALDEISNDHTWNAPFVTTNRERKTTIDESFLVPRFFPTPFVFP
jgi:hypothetical protein